MEMVESSSFAQCGRRTRQCADNANGGSYTIRNDTTFAISDTCGILGVVEDIIL